MSKPQIIIQKHLYQRPWFIILLLAAIVGVGIGIWQLVIMGDNARPQTANVQTTTAGDPTKLEPTTEFIEYSNKTVDPLSLVTCEAVGAEITTEGSLDLKTVGRQPVIYQVKYNGEERQHTVDFTIRDTSEPTIDFVVDELTIEQGDEFDAKTNIKKVADEVDGDLAYLATAPTTTAKDVGLEVFYEEGWYTVEGEVDSDAPGTYTLTVKACDKHGNEKTRVMTVRVNAS